MAVFRVPLTNNPEQFEINLGGLDYVVTCRYNPADEGGWYLDFDDALSGAPIAHGLPLVTGADILAGLGQYGFRGKLFCYTDGDAIAPPTYENLGVESNLYFETEEVA